MPIYSDLHIDHYKPNWKVTIYAKNLSTPIVLDRKYIEETTNDIIKISTTKLINQIGTFSIAFVMREHKLQYHEDELSNWYEKITPNDLVVIQLGREKNQFINEDLHEPYIIFIGLVSEVKKSLTFGGDMKPKRQITITGQDLGKLLLKTNIYKNDFATAFPERIQQIDLPNDNFDYINGSVVNLQDFIQMLLSALLPTEITSLEDAVRKVMDYFYTTNSSISLYVNSGNNQGLQSIGTRLQSLLSYSVYPFLTDNGQEPAIQYFISLSPFMLTIWDLLQKYAVPQPYNEIIIKENKTDLNLNTELMIRGMDKYISYDTFALKETAEGSTTHYLTENDLGIASYDLKRSDEHAYSVWLMSPISPLNGTLEAGNLQVTGLAWCPANLAKYGFNVFQNVSNYYIYPGQANTMLTLPADVSRSIGKLTALLPEQEEGTLVVKGNSNFQIGDILQITFNNKTIKRYYISGITHDFSPFYGSWYSVLSVSRGTPISRNNNN